MASMDITGADENIGERVDIIVWTLVALSGATLALRIWCKCSKQRGLWWDDSLLMVAWAFLLACAIIGSYNRTIGFGRHIFVVNPTNFPALGLNSNISATFSVLGAVWSKTSCALTMLRLMQGSVAKSCIWFMIVSMNTAMFCTVIFTWIRCTPPDKLAHCMDADVYMSYSIFSGSYSAAMDFILAFLPWPLIWGLQMKKTEKIGVSLVMSLGVFAGVTAVMKCVALPSLANGDFTYNSAQIVIWGNAEVATTIMAASIPVLRVLVVGVKTSTERYYGTGSKQTHSTGLQSRYNTTITSNRERNGCQLHGNFSRNKDAAGDDRSDKSILNGNSPRTGEIVQTNEIMLEYSERGAHEESEGWYEMTNGVTGKSRQDSRCQGP